MTNYYETSEWKRLRVSAVIRDGYKCVRCGSTKNLTVHHIQPRGEGGKDCLENLKTVCKSCHVKEHKDLMRGEKYNPSNTELEAMGIYYG